MEKQAKELLMVNESDRNRVWGLHVIRPKRPWYEASFFEGFFLQGIRVDRIQSQPGSMTCTFKVPARLTDTSGNLSVGAIASLVDKAGFSCIYADGFPWKISTDMSISYMSSAKLGDELEITSMVLGYKGGYTITQVLLTNKTAGEIVAEGRHSLFSVPQSKI